MKRFLRMAKVRPDAITEYIERHANAPATLLRALSAACIQNYSIAEKDGTLISFFEYTGENFEADMQILKNNPASEAWNQELECYFIHGEEEACWEEFHEVFHME